MINRSISDDDLDGDVSSFCTDDSSDASSSSSSSSHFEMFSGGKRGCSRGSAMETRELQDAWRKQEQAMKRRRCLLRGFSGLTMSLAVALAALDRLVKDLDLPE